MGLGLTVAKVIAKELEGCVWCESTKGKGSKFSFCVRDYSTKSWKQITERQGSQRESRKFHELSCELELQTDQWGCEI